jgi:predicted RNA-binding Zn ribbon-like protein
MTGPTGVTAGEKRPAPGPLLRVQSFVNTLDQETGRDLLAGDGAAVQWLRDAGLLAPDGSVSASEVETARSVREAIRALLRHNNGGPAPSASDQRILSELAGASSLRLTNTDGQIGLAAMPAGSLTAGLASLLLIMRDAQHDGSWERLKACGNDECRWAFYDRSHARLSTWCEMATCGNLIKNRNLRARTAARK